MLMHVESKTKKRKTGKGRSYLLHQKLFEDEEGKGQPPPPPLLLQHGKGGISLGRSQVAQQQQRRGGGGGVTPPHRRSMKTEEKAKFVVSVQGEEYSIPCLASCFDSMNCTKDGSKEKNKFILFLKKSFYAKQLARQGIEYIFPPKKTEGQLLPFLLSLFYFYAPPPQIQIVSDVTKTTLLCQSFSCQPI